MKAVLFSLGLSVSTTLFAGGPEGPCPVPKLFSHYIASQKCHESTEPIHRMQLVDGSGRLLYQNDRMTATKVVTYRHDQAFLPMPASLATFADPLSVVYAPDLREVSIPQWFEPANPLYRGEDLMVGALTYSRGDWKQYYTYKVTKDGGGSIPLCKTPWIKGLRTSQGSEYPNFYFQSISRVQYGSSVSVYRMDVERCLWSQVTSFVDDNDLTGGEVIYFAKLNSTLVSTGKLVLWRDFSRTQKFEISAKEVLPIDLNKGSVILRTADNDLEIFLPRQNRGSVILEGAKNFTRDHFAYSPSEGALFVAASVEDCSKTGVYEFVLQLGIL